MIDSSSRSGTLHFDPNEQSGKKSAINSWLISESYQRPINEKYVDLWKEYQSVLDLRGKDSSLPHAKVPKARSVVNTLVTRDARVVLAMDPLIELSSRNPDYKQDAKHYSNYIQFLLDEAGSFEHFIRAFIQRHTFGLTYVDIRPAIGKNGYFRLDVSIHDPWNVAVDPMAVRDDEKCRWMNIMHYVSRAEVLAKVERGDYGDNVDADRIRFDDSRDILESESGPYQDWNKRMLEALNQRAKPVDSDIAMILEHWTPDRHVLLFDGHTELLSQPNPLNKGPYAECYPLTRIVGNVDGTTTRAFQGEGAIAPFRAQFKMLDTAWSLAIQNYAFFSHGGIVIDPQRFSVDSFKLRPGGVYPAKANVLGPNDDIRKGFHQLNFQSVSKDHFAMKAAISQDIDLGTGVHELDRAEAPPSGQTATASNLLAEAGSLKAELSARIIENIGLRKIARICLNWIDQYATPFDYVEGIGSKAALELQTQKPSDIPDGVKVNFKGAARINQQQVKLRNFESFATVAFQSPYSNHAPILQEWGDLNDIAPEKVETFILPEGVVQQRRQEELTETILAQAALSQKQARDATSQGTQKSRTMGAGINPAGKDSKITTRISLQRELSNG